MFHRITWTTDELKRNVHEQNIIIILVFKIIIHRALKSGIRNLRSCLKPAHEYEPHILPNTKVSAAKDQAMCSSDALGFTGDTYQLLLSEGWTL